MPPADKQPPAQPALLALGREKFGALSLAEEELFRAAQDGRAASALDVDEKENDPANAANWKADRVVRAECVSWVCTNKQASVLVTHCGLHLRGMRIDGELDLNDAEIKFPFRAQQCAFSEKISLRDTHIRGFYLVGCQIRNLNAGRAIIDGPVLLRSSKAKGEVNLMDATIGGDLDCEDAQFSNARGVALDASGAKIEGSVFLRRGFKAEGEVYLLASRIGRSLDCTGAQFSNAAGLALAADGAKIEVAVFLSGVHAEGLVRLLGIKIGGPLDCGGAQFSNVDDVALGAEGARIEGNAFLRDGFRAQGQVDLAGATIGNLHMYHSPKSKQAILNLRHTKVGTFWDDEGSWPAAGNLLIDGFRYERLDVNAPLQVKSRKKWLSLQPRDRFRPQPYEQLASVLRQMGHSDEARQIMIAKNRERGRFTHFPLQSWWWYKVVGRLIGYGYAPWRAFAMSVVMILLGTFLFYVGSTHGLISPTKENAYAKAPNGQVIREKNDRPKISKEYPVFKSFVYSLESFIPLLKLDQSANWVPNANHGAEISPFHFGIARTGSLLRYYLYFHIAAGWLLTTLWVGAITGLVKT